MINIDLLDSLNLSKTFNNGLNFEACSLECGVPGLSIFRICHVVVCMVTGNNHHVTKNNLLILSGILNSLQNCVHIRLCSLMNNGTSRYNELLHNVSGISNTMLSQTLRELERDRLVVRKEYLEVPVRVEYEASEKTRRLQPILMELIRWSMTGTEGAPQAR